MTQPPPRRRQSVLLLLDQVVASGSNALAVFFAAWALSVPELNAYSIAQLVVITSIALQRAIFLEPGMSLSNETMRLGGVGRWLAVSWIPAAVLTITTGTVLIGDWEGAVAGLLVVMPGVQDLLRFRMFAAGKVVRALVSDSIWLVALILGYVLLAPSTAIGMLMLWTGAAGISTLSLIGRTDARAAIPILEVLALGRYQVTEWLIASATSSVPLFIVGALSPASPVGAYRLAQTLTGPLNTISSFVTVRFLMDSGRLKALDPRSAMRLLRRAAVLLVAVAASYSVVVLLAVWLLGSTFDPTLRQQLLVALPVTLASSIITAPAVAYTAFIKARSLQRLAIRPRLITLAVNLVTVFLGLVGWATIGLDPLVLPIIATAVALVLAWHAAVARAFSGRNE